MIEITPGNARAFASQMEQGQPFKVATGAELGQWLRSVADILDHYGMQIATLEAVNAKERQIVEVLHHSIKKYLAHRDCTCDECRLLQNVLSRTYKEQTKQ